MVDRPSLKVKDESELPTSELVGLRWEGQLTAAV
jgi:hypothetical protein